jgi:hypothetical protein
MEGQRQQVQLSVMSGVNHRTPAETDRKKSVLEGVLFFICLPLFLSVICD